jgi:60 kDa SS-A/Ro ribonucleoprotein
MANKNLFQTIRGALLPAATVRNDAGAPAYELSPKATLARLAATGCLTRTFYATAETQLDRVLEVAQQVDTAFLAQTALYARRKGHMKDMPALLCAVLATRDLDRLIEIFPQVIDNGKMLRNFVQILRSGVTGRKSLGSAPKRLVRQWLERANERQLLNAAIGNDPSLADVVKMVHPRPADATREAFYAWLVGKPYDTAALPETLRAFEAWKLSKEGEVPDVPFQMLTALDLGDREWAAIAGAASWQTTRMNLNTFARHGVFKFGGMAEKLAARLADPEQIRRARVFPYQLLVAFLNAGKEVPGVLREALREALQDAMEVALSNVPEIYGSAVRCVDVAGLVAAAFLRKNRNARIIPFKEDVVHLELNPRDTVMTNATKLSSLPPGATNCSAPLRLLNSEKATPDLVVFVSDNESWTDPKSPRGTAVMAEWEKLKNRNPKARLVCIDLVPNTTTQAPDRKDILNIGGFSDAVFDLIAAFAAGADGADHWIREIELQPLNERMKLA